MPLKGLVAAFRSTKVHSYATGPYGRINRQWASPIIPYLPYPSDPEILLRHPPLPSYTIFHRSLCCLHHCCQRSVRTLADLDVTLSSNLLPSRFSYPPTGLCTSRTLAIVSLICLDVHATSLAQCDHPSSPRTLTPSGRYAHHRRLTSLDPYHFHASLCLATTDATRTILHATNTDLVIIGNRYTSSATTPTTYYPQLGAHSFGPRRRFV